MENWGLVTYRETCLLVDDQNTSTQRRQWVAIVVGHELAHQWFGNLVTMVTKSFFEKLIDWIFNSYINWNRNGGLICGWMKVMPLSWNLFVSITCSPSSKSGHNSSQTLRHRRLTSTVWRIRIPSKSPLVIQMKSARFLTTLRTAKERPSSACCTTILEMTLVANDRLCKLLINNCWLNWMTQDFRRGMKLYLTRHMYGNTFAEDLWAALSEASKKPVGNPLELVQINIGHLFRRCWPTRRTHF